eukprot:1092447-Rhodomonas_salina.1
MSRWKHSFSGGSPECVLPQILHACVFCDAEPAAAPPPLPQPRPQLQPRPLPQPMPPPPPRPPLWV